MSYELKVLKEGYSYLKENVMKANSTCTLLIGEKKILVDVLSAWDKEFLIKALGENGIKCEQIDYVICTHGHSDHIGNLNLFTHATHIIGTSINHGDEYDLHPFTEVSPYVINEDAQVIVTPGHTLTDVSLVVKTKNFGTVIVAGDLFERKEDLENPNLWKYVAGSENIDLQSTHRARVLHMADYIVPGHGPMFKVDEQMRNKNPLNSEKEDNI